VSEGRRVEELAELLVEPAALGDHLQLLVRVEIHLADDHLEFRPGQAEIGKDLEVALGPDRVVVFVRGIDTQHVEDVRRDVVVQCRRRIRQQQRRPPRARPDDHEELVIDRQQTERRPRRTQLAQFRDRRVQLGEGPWVQGTAPPPTVLTDHRNREARDRFLHRHAHTVFRPATERTHGVHEAPRAPLSRHDRTH